MPICRTLISLLTLTSFVAAQPPKPDKFKDPLKVGVEMPFHVVQFQVGPHKGGGCPGVMIANTKSRGLVIWSRGVDAAALQLAQDADAKLIDNDKALGFLVVFDEKGDELQAKLAKLELKRVSAGWARRTAADFFAHAGIDPASAVVVSVLDKDTVKAVWSFKPDELTKEKRGTILKETFELLKSINPTKQ
jgi:hypothetical protein